MHGSSKWNIVYHFVYRKARAVFELLCICTEIPSENVVMDVRICQCYHCQFLIPIKHGEELWVGLGTGNGGSEGHGDLVWL